MNHPASLLRSSLPTRAAIVVALAVPAAAGRSRPATTAGALRTIDLVTPPQYAVLRPEKSGPGVERLPVTFTWERVRGAAGYSVALHRAEAYSSSGKAQEPAYTTKVKEPRWTFSLPADGYVWEVSAFDARERLIASSALGFLNVCPSASPTWVPPLDVVVDHADPFPTGVAALVGHVYGDACRYVVITVNQGGPILVTPQTSGLWTAQVDLTKPGPNDVMVVATDGHDIRQVALTIDKEVIKVWP